MSPLKHTQGMELASLCHQLFMRFLMSKNSSEGILSWHCQSCFFFFFFVKHDFLVYETSALGEANIFAMCKNIANDLVL